MKAIIDPQDNILYKSFYIYALQSILGKKNVLYSNSIFSTLTNSARNTCSFRFVIDNGQGELTRYCISCNDSYIINNELYEWCDIYGGVNINYEKIPTKFHNKMIPLCPSFGINIYSFAELVFQSIRTLTTADPRQIKKHMGKYKRLYLGRPNYEDYVSPLAIEDNYVYFCSTLWYNDEWNHNDNGVNGRRANFIRACHELEDINFEGGLVAGNKSSKELFSDCLCHPYSMKEWMTNTKKSICVFNTPAFWDCHGWKLGEYLALGKAIVSTKLSNDLPAPLIHGENIHYVENDIEDMKEAVNYISLHPSYRIKLENGAKKYWETYGTPEQSLRLLGIHNY